MIDEMGLEVLIFDFLLWRISGDINIVATKSEIIFSCISMYYGLRSAQTYEFNEKTAQFARNLSAGELAGFHVCGYIYAEADDFGFWHVFEPFVFYDAANKGLSKGGAATATDDVK